MKKTVCGFLLASAIAAVGPSRALAETGATVRFVEASPVVPEQPTQKALPMSSWRVHSSRSRLQGLSSH